MPISTRGENLLQILHFRFHLVSIFWLTPIKIYQEFKLFSITYVIVLFGEKVKYLKIAL